MLENKKFSLKLGQSFKNKVNRLELGFPGGAVVKNSPVNAGDMGLSPGLERSHMPQSNEAHEPQLLSLYSRA